MQFILIKRQGGGCDYTIGCGIRIRKLKSTNKGDARIEARDLIGSQWGSQNEDGIEEAELLQVEDT